MFCHSLQCYHCLFPMLLSPSFFSVLPLALLPCMCILTDLRKAERSHLKCWWNILSHLHIRLQCRLFHRKIEIYIIAIIISRSRWDCKINLLLQLLKDWFELARRESSLHNILNMHFTIHALLHMCSFIKYFKCNIIKTTINHWNIILLIKV